MHPYQFYTFLKTDNTFINVSYSTLTHIRAINGNRILNKLSDYIYKTDKHIDT